MKVNIKSPRTVRLDSSADGLFVVGGRLYAKTGDREKSAYECYDIITGELCTFLADAQVHYLKSITVEVAE